MPYKYLQTAGNNPGLTTPHLVHFRIGLETMSHGTAPQRLYEQGAGAVRAAACGYDQWQDACGRLAPPHPALLELVRLLARRAALDDVAQQRAGQPSEE